MKKIILSSVTVISFLFYGLYVNSNKAKNSTAVLSQPNISSSPSLPEPKPLMGYHDGQYIGSVQDAYYGNIQVEAQIANGKISDVLFLQFPNDRSNSVAINDTAMPILKEEAISAQDANVEIVTGATDTSQAFIESLKTALAAAKGK